MPLSEQGCFVRSMLTGVWLRCNLPGSEGFERLAQRDRPSLSNFAVSAMSLACYCRSHYTVHTLAIVVHALMCLCLADSVDGTWTSAAQPELRAVQSRSSGLGVGSESLVLLIAWLAPVCGNHELVTRS